MISRFIVICFLISSSLFGERLEFPRIKDHANIPKDSSKRPSSYPYIAGDTFRAVCDFIIDETNVPFDTDLVKDGDTIFVKHNKIFLDFFFGKVHPKIKAKYILITHNGLCDNLDPYKKFMDDETIVAWMGKNVIIDHPKASALPIGLSNKHWHCGNVFAVGNIIKRLPINKNILLCLNFALGSSKERRGSIRRKVYNFFKNKSFCSKIGKKPFSKYLEDIARSKFVLSPEGNGIDCHRTWEAMLLGSIPIISSSGLDDLFKDLPVIIVDDWAEISEEYLVAKYDEMINKEYKLEKLCADYWLQKIEQVKVKSKSKNGYLEYFPVGFYQSMSRSRSYKKSAFEKSSRWQKLKQLFDEHIINNPKYSETPKIPKIIHQIWLGGGGKLPEKYKQFQKTWIEMHPDWEYKLWTEKEIDEFGLTRRDLYDETNNYGVKSDIARYDILYKVGGLYVDTDFECIKPFDVFHHICDFYAGCGYHQDGVIFNGLIGSAPGHPILKSFIFNMKHKKKGPESANDVFKRTSVRYIAQCFFEEIDKHNGPSVIFPVTYFYPWPHYFRKNNSRKEVQKWINPETFANHHWHVSWKKKK